MDTKLTTCQNCRGNGYVRLAQYEETQTCKECGGAGYFGSISIHQQGKTTNGQSFFNKG